MACLSQNRISILHKYALEGPPESFYFYFYVYFYFLLFQLILKYSKKCNVCSSPTFGAKNRAEGYRGITWLK